MKAAARRRLEALIPMATDILAELANGHAMDPGTDAAICVPPAVRARACAEILSRAGIPVTSEIDLAVSESTNAGLDARITAALDARSPAVPVPETQEAR